MVKARDSEFYTLTETAGLLGVSPSTVWRWVKAGKLPAYRVGPRSMRVRKTDLKKVLVPVHQESQVKPPAGPGEWITVRIGDQPPRRMTIAEFKAELAKPISPEELARRQRAYARAMELRKQCVITPLTTADLVRQVREERLERYASWFE